MRLNELLETFPWHDTFDALCQEPPEERSLQLADARQLIAQQRKSQLAVLLRMMHSPLLESNEERANDSSEQRDHVATTSRRLRRPDQVSRLFLATAAQAGKALRPFGPERLGELDRDDAALGRLLRVLSLAQSSPRTRAAHAHEWPEIATQGAESRRSSPFGSVLTPMLFSAGFEGRSASRPNYPDLVARLAMELSETTRGGDRVSRWTRGLVRAGAVRLRRLREGSRGALLAQLGALKRQGVDDPDIDLWIGLFSGDTEAVGAALDAGADVNVTIDEVLRRHRSRL